MKNDPIFPFPFLVYPAVPSYIHVCCYCNEPIRSGQSYRIVRDEGAREKTAHIPCADEVKKRKESNGNQP